MSKLLKSVILGISIVAMQPLQASETARLTRSQLPQKITYVGTAVACAYFAARLILQIPRTLIRISPPVGMFRPEKSLAHLPIDAHRENWSRRDEADRETGLTDMLNHQHDQEKIEKKRTKKYACGLVFAGALLAWQHMSGWNK